MDIPPITPNNHITLSEECLTCRRKFNFQEPVLIKIDSKVCMCLECSEKYPDDTVYPEGEGWLCEEYEKGKTIWSVDADEMEAYERENPNTFIK